jgi:hypothetical protein
MKKIILVLLIIVSLASCEQKKASFNYIAISKNDKYTMKTNTPSTVTFKDSTIKVELFYKDGSEVYTYRRTEGWSDGQLDSGLKYKRSHVLDINDGYGYDVMKNDELFVINGFIGGDWVSLQLTKNPIR